MTSFLPLTFIIICTSIITSSLAKKGDFLPCKHFNLVRYRATFEANWSEDQFPKQYPTVRPPAQWSKMIGRTHNDDYRLWSLGKLALTAFKKFAQDGSSELLDKLETQGYDGILDSFTTPPLMNGVGQIDTDFFASNTHQLVSIAIRVVPSPDWFVGLNSFHLCQNDSWLHELRVPVALVDAGTDRGFTFTSPKWASRPQERMYQITSQYPNHRASSFYYPNLKTLPNIGYVKFELLTDYKQRKVHRQVKNYRDENEIPELEEDVEKKREENEEKQILHGEPVVATKPVPEIPKAYVTQSYHVGDKNDVQDTDNYLDDNRNRPASIMKKYDMPLAKSERKDCLTTEWSLWTQCSKTCGFGVQKRYRKVTQIPVQGRPCPNLVQEKWCGGMRNCRDKMKLFSWLNKNKSVCDEVGC